MPKVMPKVASDSRNLLTGLVLVFPLLFLYQLGVVAIYPMINGADFLTRFLFQNVGLSRSAYLGYTILVGIDHQCVDLGRRELRLSHD